MKISKMIKGMYKPYILPNSINMQILISFYQHCEMLDLK